jgi:type IV secretory pathway VirB9-like protein
MRGDDCNGVLFMRQLFATVLLSIAAMAPAVADEASSPLAPEKVGANQTLVYGKGDAVLTCAPAHYCALSLQQGETIKSIEGGGEDWSITPTTYGAGNFATPVVILSPHGDNLKTRLDITTDRRSYAVTLVGTAGQWTPLTAFSYPAP